MVIVLMSVLARPSGAYRGPWDGPSWRENPHRLAQWRVDIGPDAAAAKVREATGGRILGVSRNDLGVYQVKVLLPGGVVRIVPVDSRTGRIGQ